MRNFLLEFCFSLNVAYEPDLEKHLGKIGKNQV